jgi:plasmid stability protein
MNVTLSIDDDVIREARRRAEAMGTSVNQLVRDYLNQFVGKRDPSALAAELEQLWEQGTGDSRGWRFNRDEIHERNF